MPSFAMPALTGQVMPTPSEPLPFRVVVRRGGELIRALPVDSVGEGQRKLAELLRREAQTDEPSAS
jgi:hypothetical protein